MVPVDFFALITTGFVGVLIVQVIAFIYAIRLRRVDLIDAVWGLSFIATVVALQLAKPSASIGVLLVDSLVVLWGIRLSWHIYGRFRRSSKQDERYSLILARWSTKFRTLQIFVKIFLLQAVLVSIIGLPVIVIHIYNPSLSLIIITGLLLWIVGFVCEVIADRQLKLFLREHPGELMEEGLWCYSRHPNYFGEIVIWWGVALIACATPLWWVGLIGAATITYLICFVSGIPLAEERSQMKEGWQAYQRKTSILVPWLPKQ